MLEKLYAFDSGIEDITGLDVTSRNLRQLAVQQNSITDISPFANFTNQSILSTNTSNNLVYDLSPHILNYNVSANGSMDPTFDNSLSDAYTMGNNYVTLSEIDGIKITRNADGDVIIKNPVRNRNVAEVHSLLADVGNGSNLNLWGTEPVPGDWSFFGNKPAGDGYINPDGVPVPPAKGDKFSGYEKTIYGPDGVTIYDDSTYLPDTNEIVWRNVPSNVNELYFSWEANVFGPSNGVHTTPFSGKIKIIIEDSYTVKFDANGGQGTMNEQTFQKDVEQPLSENQFTKSNNSFVGWNTKPDGTGESYSDKEVISNKNLTLYAQWSQNYYQIKFDGNTGFGTMPVVNVNQGDNFTIIDSTFTKEGHSFKNWNTKADGTGISYEVGDLFNPATAARLLIKDITLYAQWDVNNYVVSYESNGGTVVNPETVNFDQLVTKPTNPTKEGYTFMGWYKEANFLNEWNFATDKMPANNMKLYAKWSINNYEVSYESNGGTVVNPETVNFDQLVTKPTNPTREGYTFMGWYKEANFLNEWNFATDKMPANSMKLYAKWSLNNTNVIVKPEDGNKNDLVNTGLSINIIAISSLMLLLLVLVGTKVFLKRK